MPTDGELLRALGKADLGSHGRSIFVALIRVADWASGVIPNRFQPRNLEVVAAEAGMSPSTAERAIRHLERHGWVTRHKGTAPGRHGRTVAYQLHIGQPCDCGTGRPAPMTAAERARNYRERERMKSRQPDVTADLIPRQRDVTYHVRDRDDFPGQSTRGAEVGRDEGVRGWAWPDDSVGAEVNEAS